MSEPPLDVPTKLDASYCEKLAAALEAAALRLPAELPCTLPAAACIALLKRCERLLKAEPTVVQVNPPAGAEVCVVGDLHGQFFDLLTILRELGCPSASRVFVFDGDFVDRGAWSIEIVALLAALKVALPRQAFLVRGNHETEYCSWVYGFRQEVLTKYGSNDGMAVFNACSRLFQHLPLAAVVAGTALVLHGGLPRAPPRRRTRRSLPADRDQAPTVASLADIAASSKGGPDPEPERQDQRLAADVLWSDPGSRLGIQLGARPGDVGVQFGPDVTEAFLRDNGLRLILRGHEGPDARAQRGDMQPMSQGYTLDHETPAGQLYTVFSAPCYPQFGEQYNNLGAVALLAPPAYDRPRFVQFAAAPRPEATPYYCTETQGEDGEVADAGPLDAAGTADMADAAGVAEGQAARSEEASSDAEEEGHALGGAAGGLADSSLDQGSGSSQAPAAAAEQQAQAVAAIIGHAARLSQHPEAPHAALLGSGGSSAGTDGGGGCSNDAVQGCTCGSGSNVAPSLASGTNDEAGLEPVLKRQQQVDGLRSSPE